MVDFLEKESSAKGVIKASSKWLPSCSFLEDTVRTLWEIKDFPSDTYNINSNEKYDFFKIVNLLKIKLSKKEWKILETKDFIYNQIMIDDRVHIPKLSKKFS